MLISYVIPCYRSAQTIAGVVSEIETTMQREGRVWELVLVDDSSPDTVTWPELERLSAAYPNVTSVRLARNFGQHAAIMAGLHYTRGDVIVCLDDDGQTPADEAGKLIDALDEDCDVAYARYQQKQHSLFRNFGSAVNEKMAEALLGKPGDLYVSSYFAAKRFVVDEMLKYTNPYPYLIGLVLRTTKKIRNVDVTHRARQVGVSGYSMGKLVALWMNGFTAFSVKPLRIATLAGAGFACAGFLLLIYIVIRKLVDSSVLLGWSSVVCVMLTIGGMLMLMLGLIGEYIGRIYISLNASPQFIVREVKGEQHADEG